MIPRLVTLCLALALAGCLNSYEEEYRATLRELEQTREALAQAQQKLAVADDESRQEITALARQINRHLQAGELAPAALERMAETMQLYLGRYRHLGDLDDRIGTLARFYHQRTAAVADLERRRTATYQQQYDSCLKEANKTGNGNQLGALLCEVQAELAQRQQQTDLQASIKALTELGEELLQTRHATTVPPTLAQIQTRFETQYERFRTPAAD